MCYCFSLKKQYKEIAEGTFSIKRNLKLAQLSHLQKIQKNLLHYQFWNNNINNGIVDINKLRQPEEEFKSLKPEKITNKSMTLTVKEKAIGNNRCRFLKFPKDFCGLSGDAFTNPMVTLKNKHGWTEIRF